MPLRRANVTAPERRASLVARSARLQELLRTVCPRADRATNAPAGIESISTGRTVAAEFTMVSDWSRGQHRLLAAITLAVVIFLGDIIALNVMGEVPSALWILAVPVGLLIVPVVGVVCTVLLAAERRQA